MRVLTNEEMVAVTGGCGKKVAAIGPSGATGATEEVIVYGSRPSNLNFTQMFGNLAPPSNGPSLRPAMTAQERRTAENNLRNNFVISQRRNGMNDADQINLNYLRARNAARRAGYQIP